MEHSNDPFESQGIIGGATHMLGTLRSLSDVGDHGACKVHSRGCSVAVDGLHTQKLHRRR